MMGTVCNKYDDKHTHKTTTQKHAANASRQRTNKRSNCKIQNINYNNTDRKFLLIWQILLKVVLIIVF